MRGKVSAISWAYKSGGITPAYAGKSEPSGFMLPTSQDHPRLCGEKYWSQSRARPMAGSPPPMRGKGFALSVLPPPVGITPAYAGKSYGITEVYDNKKGSPPPMRGKG